MKKLKFLIVFCLLAAVSGLLTAAESKVALPPNPPPAGKYRPGNPPPGNGASMNRHRRPPAFLRVIDRLDEPEKDKLFKLLDNDPAAFKMEIDRLSAEMKAERAKKTAVQNALAADYIKAVDPAERQAIEGKLREVITNEYNMRLVRAEKRLRDAEHMLKIVSDDYQKRLDNADRIIDVRMKFILDRAEKNLNSNKNSTPPSAQ